MFPDYGTDDTRTGDWRPDDPEACNCGLRADEEPDVRGEHHMRRCPRFAFAPAVANWKSAVTVWECKCGHRTETVDDVGRVYSVQCGCGREMRRVQP